MTPMPDLSAGSCTSHHPTVMHPEPAWADGINYARTICLGISGRVPPCPVLAVCRDWILAHPDRESGVWGGLSEQERRNLRRRRTA